jgi:L-threonylcarbamoyladenylate synthase
MVLIKTSETNMVEVLHRVAETLENGSIIAYPTETFYGLGVKFDIEDSLKKLYEIKQRPKEKAMPLIIGNTELLSVVTTSLNPTAILLIERFWPGPLTLVLPAKENLSEYITAGSSKVAVRIPGESFALHLARTINFPITATSANLSGMPPAQDAETVIKYFGDKIDLVIDGGPTRGVLPSTIVDVTEDEIKILREGMIKKELLTFV